MGLGEMLKEKGDRFHVSAVCPRVGSEETLRKVWFEIRDNPDTLTGPHKAPTQHFILSVEEALKLADELRQRALEAQTMSRPPKEGGK